MPTENSVLVSTAPAGLASFRYKEEIDSILITRTRILIVLAATLYLVAIFFDSGTYPSLAAVFFTIRMAVCAGVAALFFLTFFKRLKGHIVWISDAVILFLAGGVALMTYLADGSQSHYYEGIRLLIVATLIMNSFYFWHVAGVFFLVLLFYTLAALGNTVHWIAWRYFFSTFFMFSAAVLVLTMIRLYINEYRRTFASRMKMEGLYSQADTLSKIDDLTQIDNRRFFLEILTHKIGESQRTGTAFYLVFLDIDRFKTINDSYGHNAGDRAICMVVDLVRSSISASSHMGRYGGDEFMFFIDMPDRAAFLGRLEQIKRKVQDVKLHYAGKEIPLSVSFGAVCVDPSRYKTSQSVIDVADKAMLSVKRSKPGEIYLVE